MSMSGMRKKKKEIFHISKKKLVLHASESLDGYGAYPKPRKEDKYELLQNRKQGCCQ